MINRFLSANRELLHLIEFINCKPELSKKMQYDFYFYSIPKKYYHVSFNKKKVDKEDSQPPHPEG
jgi:hypothetical protein